MEREDNTTAPLYIPSFFTDELAMLRLIAEALRRAEYLVDCANQSHHKKYVAPDYIPKPLDNVFLTTAKSMRAYNELLAAVKADFYAETFIADLKKLDYSHLCGIAIPAIPGLQNVINRNFGIEEATYCNKTEDIKKNEPRSKHKTQTITDRIKFFEAVKNNSLSIIEYYDDDIEDTEPDSIDKKKSKKKSKSTEFDGTWSIGGCAHIRILAGLLKQENKDKNKLSLGFIQHNLDKLIASYVQWATIKTVRDLAKEDLQRWHRLLSLVGYGSEPVLRGDVIGLAFGMVVLDKRSYKPQASAWYNAPLTAKDTFEASCALCGKPFPNRVRFGDLLSGRVFSCGCSAPKTMYAPALQQLKAAAVRRFQAKRSECATSDKAFSFSSEDDFLESVGLPWSYKCLDLSRLNDHRYNNVPYAPGYVFWECSSSNRARGAKVTKRRRLDVLVDCNAPKMPYSLSGIRSYEWSPGFHEKMTLDTWLENYGKVEGTRDKSCKNKSSIKLDTCSNKSLGELLQIFQEVKPHTFQ